MTHRRCHFSGFSFPRITAFALAEARLPSTSSACTSFQMSSISSGTDDSPFDELRECAFALTWGSPLCAFSAPSGDGLGVNSVLTALLNGLCAILGEVI